MSGTETSNKSTPMPVTISRLIDFHSASKMANFVPNLSLLLGFLSFFVKLVQGEEYSKFLYPNDPAQVFYYLDTINVTYESSFAAPGLWTFCKDVNVDSYFPSK